MAALQLHRLIAAALLALPLPAFALHDVHATQWTFEPGLALLLAASALFYAAGVRALWREAGRGRGIRPVEAGRFALGWIALAAALLTPLDTLAGRSFGVHMVQHELLMVVAAPLLALGRPLEAWAWALPRAAAALAGLGRNRALQAAWRWMTEPVGAWCVHAAALWLWHLPVFFVAALESQALHVLQHTAFFASALAFWWSVFGRAGRRPGAVALASLFTTMLHTGVLGALLTFAPSTWYMLDRGAPPFGLTPLEDQQLGGLVMWVPGSLAYLAAALAIVARWLVREPPSPRPRTGDSPACS